MSENYRREKNTIQIIFLNQSKTSMQQYLNPKKKSTKKGENLNNETFRNKYNAHIHGCA